VDASTHRNCGKGDAIVKNLIARFVREDDGQDVIEYALLAAFVSIIAATIIQSIGPDLKNIFTAVEGQTKAGAGAGTGS
jgi:Flp pilus assembly pilin Flp